MVENLASEFTNLHVSVDEPLFRPRNAITRAESVKIIIKLIEKVFKG